MILTFLYSVSLQNSPSVRNRGMTFLFLGVKLVELLSQVISSHAEQYPQGSHPGANDPVYSRVPVAFQAPLALAVPPVIPKLFSLSPIRYASSLILAFQLLKTPTKPHTIHAAAAVMAARGKLRR